MLLNLWHRCWIVEASTLRPKDSNQTLYPTMLTADKQQLRNPAIFVFRYCSNLSIAAWIFVWLMWVDTCLRSWICCKSGYNLPNPIPCRNWPLSHFKLRSSGLEWFKASLILVSWQCGALVFCPSLVQCFRVPFWASILSQDLLQSRPRNVLHPLNKLHMPQLTFMFLFPSRLSGPWSGIWSPAAARVPSRKGNLAINVGS